MFETFHCISLLLFLNYVQMMEVHTYTWMCFAKLKCFLCLEIISSSSDSLILFLSPASCLFAFLFLLSPSVHAVQMRGNCSFFQVPALFNWHKELIFWLSGREINRDSWTTWNNPRNPDLIALWFLLRLENGNTTQWNSINFSSVHHGVVILAQKSFGLFSVYMAIFLLSSGSQSPAKYRASSESYRCKEKIVSCFGLSGWRVLGGVILLLWMGSACAHHAGDLTKCSEGGQPKPKVIPTFPASEKLPDSPRSEGELLRQTPQWCLGLFL